MKKRNFKQICCWKDYYRAYADLRRNKKKAIPYFLEWNSEQINPIELDEYKLFTPADYYYIKKTHEYKNKQK